MKRRIRTEKLRENALVAFQLALHLAQDQEFRQRLSSALEHSREARRRIRPDRGITGAARRLAADQALHEELEDARRDLQQAYDLVGAKKRGRRLRRLAPLAGLASLASLAAVPQVREHLSALMATASKHRKHVQDLAAARIPGGVNGRPTTLEDLTKEELYGRAQEADIPGRSEMSKEELIAALRAKS